MMNTMHTTRHMQQRMSQRGINRDMVELVLAYGRLEKDRYVLSRKEALSLLRLLKKIVDKGGVVVVAEGASLLTAYNYDSREHWGRA